MKKLIILLILKSCFLFSQENITKFLQKADSLYANTQYKKALIVYNSLSKQELIKNDINYIHVALQKIKINSSLRKHNRALKDITLLKTFILNNNIKNDSLWVSIINLNSLILKGIGKFKKSLALNDKLLIDEERYKKHIQEIFHTRSRIEIDLELYDEASISAKKTIAIYRKNNDSLNLAAIYNILGVVYYFKQDLDSTLYYYLKSLAIKKSIKKDNSQLAISSYNIGIVYEDIVNYKKAIKYYLDAVDYDLKDGGESVGFLIEIYGALLNTYGALQDYENVEKYANKLSSLLDNKSSDEYPYLTFAYIAYSGVKTMQEDYITAINYVNKALKIRKKVFGKNHKWTIECWLILGKLHTKTKNYTKAFSNFQKALKKAKTINDKEKIVEISKSLGQFFITKKEYINAQKSFTYAINNVSDKFFETKELRYELNYLKAKTYYLQDEFIVAKTLIDQLKKVSINNASLYINYVNMLDLENDILIKSFDTTGIFNNLNEILRYLSKIKNNYSSINSKIYISNNFDAIIDNSVTICYNLYVKTKEAKYKIKALEFSEFNRNSSLLEGLQNVEIKQKVGVPIKILKAENSIRKKIAKVKQELFYLKEEEHEDYVTFNNLSTDYILLSNKLDSLQEVLKQDYPNYYQLKNISNKFDLARIQQTIKTDELIVEYYFSKDYLFVFYIQKDSLEFYSVKNSTELNTKILTFRELLNQQKDVTALTDSIYKSIIPKTITAQKIKIIPDGALNFFPFECLRYKNMYFIENKTISYTGSLNLMQFQGQISHKKSKKNWLGFAPNYKKVKNLLFNIDEVKSIRKITNGAYYINQKASKTNFLKHSKNIDVIHLATHTVLNNTNSLYNKLLFTDFEENHTLTASEIYNLDFNAKMIVLSSCNTGFGKLDKGEGVQNMSRAFTYAGIPSSIMSLWKVPDKETNVIMQSFYKYLKRGNSKSESLKKSKLEYLKNTEDKLLKHPFYWAGFIVNGDVDPIYGNSNLSYYLLGLTVLVLFVLFRKKISFKNEK